MNHTKVSRKEAFDLGHKRYFTGSPCKRGHVAERFVTTGVCVKCNSERASLFRKDRAAVPAAIRSGMFIYPLHPDDHAAAHAYCQALDMARGRLPQAAPTAKVVPADPTPEQMREMRNRIHGFDVDAVRNAALSSFLDRESAR